MFLSCEDRANLRTLQIIETEKQAKVNISSLNKEEKKMILISAEKNARAFDFKLFDVLTETQVHFKGNVLAF